MISPKACLILGSVDSSAASLASLTCFSSTAGNSLSSTLKQKTFLNNNKINNFNNH